jgi:murein DD-endopeptidase MepM/ murein hydrolase activator NlpD
MKKLLLIALISSQFSTIFGQTEKDIYKTVVGKFEKNYNESKYDSIFAMFSEDMQKAITYKNTISFLTNSKKKLGKIVDRKFIKYKQGVGAIYKTNFEKTLFSINVSLDKNTKINGLSFEEFTEFELPKFERNSTKLMLPFNGTWNITWGGDTKELNYHVESQAQKNAFDILIQDNEGKTHKANGKSNEDYYAFGKELIAPCDGEIILAVDGVKDNIPGVLNPTFLTGNTVIIKTSNNEFLFFAHFKNHSIKVQEGQKVKQGQLLGLCGNSGNSSEPHLHFHIQNIENMSEATGVKCYFDKVMVDGVMKTDYSPIKKEKISNL